MKMILGFARSDKPEFEWYSCFSSKSHIKGGMDIVKHAKLISWIITLAGIPLFATILLEGAGAFAQSERMDRTLAFITFLFCFGVLFNAVWASYVSSHNVLTSFRVRLLVAEEIAVLLAAIQQAGVYGGLYDLGLFASLSVFVVEVVGCLFIYNASLCIGIIIGRVWVMP